MPSTTSPMPKRSTVIVASLATVILVAGVAVTRFSGNDSRSGHPTDPQAAAEPTPRPPVAEGTPGPTLERAGLDVGFSDDEEGAVAAAVSYSTAAQRWLYFTDDEIRAAVDEIATPVAAPRMADDIVLEVSMARDQLGESSGRVWWLVRPLAWNVETFDGDQARVAVWVVTILSAAEVAAPQSEFLTVTVDLAWLDGDWRVDGVRDHLGPTPMTGPQDQPWDAVPFDETLAGFTRLDGEPVQ
ncbi:MAG: hypothetical protein R2689_05450 [Microthrixaceae bacterium]|jgi:hypothetical protein|nr:hypothetical protein [Acidimicrobiia bacterium]HNA35479.1 hypothetical protein [Microthrixaceae bacterium]HNG25387.1 hypothetical protein [Microthrixaceae bacterium]